MSGRACLAPRTVAAATRHVRKGFTSHMKPTTMLRYVAVAGWLCCSASLFAQSDKPAKSAGIPLVPKAAVGGTGTANSIPKWTDSAGTLANSSMFDDGVNIGVGTTSPGGVFDFQRSSAGDLL